MKEGANVDEKSLLQTLLVPIYCYMSLNMLIKIYSMVNESGKLISFGARPLPPLMIESDSTMKVFELKNR